MLKPHLGHAINLATFEGLTSIACVGWNMAIFQDKGLQNLFPGTNGTPDQMALVEAMKIAKNRLFPGDNRLIFNCDIQVAPSGKPDVKVHSIDFEHCFFPDGTVRDGVPSGNILRWQEVKVPRVSR
jgi:hypothetical protein